MIELVKNIIAGVGYYVAFGIAIFVVVMAVCQTMDDQYGGDGSMPEDQPECVTEPQGC
jgi:hypothetical protein